MSDYGLTDQGFKRKRLDLLLSELNASVKGVFGSNFNVMPESPDGQINGIISESYASLWELANLCYDSHNPNASSGVNLSNLVAYNGIRRANETSSRVSLSLVGIDGTIVPKDTAISTDDTKEVFLTEANTSIVAGTASVFASAKSPGPIIALPNTLVNIDTPVSGLVSVTNLTSATLGTNIETDVELRSRRSKSVARDAQAVIDAIYAEIKAVSSVTNALVLENDTDVGPDINGLPAHSIHAIVIGGTDEDIATAIYIKKTLGATTFGTTSFIKYDLQGFPHSISFSRPVTVDVYVIVNLTQLNGYPANGDSEIAQALVDYANGNLIAGRGFSLGDDIIHSELYSPVNTIPGHTVDSIFIGLSPSPSLEDDVPIAISEMGNFLITNIIVNS